MSDSNNYHAHSNQIKAILKGGEKKVVDVSNRKFAHWQLSRKK